ncbi:MAG: thioredoxin family protein [Candidatus Paceibacterota bacterium]
MGSGCPTCKKLFELTKQAVEESGIEAEVEYIDDIQKIMELGVMQTPVLIIDGKIAMIGGTSGIERIKELITNKDNKTTLEDNSGCSCGGNC